MAEMFASDIVDHMDSAWRKEFDGSMPRNKKDEQNAVSLAQAHGARKVLAWFEDFIRNDKFEISLSRFLKPETVGRYQQRHSRRVRETSTGPKAPERAFNKYVCNNATGLAGILPCGNTRLCLFERDEDETDEDVWPKIWGPCDKCDGEMVRKDIIDPRRVF